MSKIYRIFVALYLVFIFIVLIFSAHLGPYRSLNNISGSMEPAIKTGSISIVRQERAYNLGDAISYYVLIDGQEQIVTHRIMGIGGNVYTTKGDANQVADREIVLPRLVVGRVIMVIPYLGYVVGYAKGPWGHWLLILLPAFAIIIREIVRIVLIVSHEKKI